MWEDSLLAEAAAGVRKSEGGRREEMSPAEGRAGMEAERAWWNDDLPAVAKSVDTAVDSRRDIAAQLRAASAGLARTISLRARAEFASARGRA